MNKSGLISGDEIFQTSLFSVEEHIDVRGSFSEVFQKTWQACIDPVQWSVVKSEKNVLRGMHFHQRHDEYFHLISGHCLVGLKDIRPDSPTLGAHSLYEMFSSDMSVLVFPRGIIHGWFFYEPSIHLQAVSESYLDYHEDDNHGCQWNAEDLGIPWPITNPVLSDRSKNFESVSDLLKLSKYRQNNCVNIS